MKNFGIFFCSFFRSVSRQSFTEYLKWEGGEENIGCIASKCTYEDGIIAVTFYEPTSDVVSINWNAINKENSLPYICQSKCPIGYTWFKGYYYSFYTDKISKIINHFFPTIPKMFESRT